jgi:transcriptional regulator with XRE-family HTH domain
MDEQRKQRFYAVINDIGTSLKDLREYRGLTVEQAAEQAELTPTRLEAIERGRLTTNLNTLTDHVERLGGRMAIVPEEHPDDPHCQFIEFED